jgi:GNAT superfamily N-acetyltransferase
VTLRVVELSAEATHPLRLAVLRADTPTKEVSFAEDLWPGVVHLGLQADGVLAATSTWVPRPFNDAPAVQLRGMATSTAYQGRGLGGALVEAGCQRFAGDGIYCVWARARDAALAFYARHGFEVVGDGFIDDATQLPHHLIVRRLTPDE